MPITMGMTCQPPPREVGGGGSETLTSLPAKFVKIANRRSRLYNLKQGPRCTMLQACWSRLNLRLNDGDL